METYTGKLRKIIYRNEDFLIASLVSDQEMTIKGSIYGVEQGEELTVYGQWEHHPKFGKQLAVERWERPIPQTEEQVIAFLASPLVKGCGEKRAVQIVDHLGPNALQRITDEGEDCLLPIKGIGPQKAQKIVGSVKSTFEVQRIMAELLVYGITANMVTRLYKEYGSNTAEVVKSNPYKLTELKLIGFLKADEISKKIGISPLSGHRIDACVDFVLKEKCFNGGHCYLPEDELIQETQRILNHNTDKKVSVEEVAQSLYRLEDKKLVMEDGCVYPKYLYQYEKELARKLSEMGGSREGEAMPSIEKRVETLIKAYQMQHNIVLAEKQREAIRTLFQEQIMILTGNPGTGKTTVIRAMLDIYKQMYPAHEVALAAPTGRASRKLAEVAGHEASTIHRLIGYRAGEEPDFNESCPLPHQLIIVDEMSMVDVPLASLLMNAVRMDAKVLFVGDVDQLPSVNPGNVLKDMIQSGLPSVKLTEIFRQAQESQIITNAHRVNQGLPLLIDESKSDMYFIYQEDPERIAQLTVRSALRFRELGYDTADILILSPMKKGPIGTQNLNERLQQALNPAHQTKKEWKVKKVIFRVGDKVIQTKNDYSKDVFNGDVGMIKDVTQVTNDEGERVDVLVCDFMGKEVVYPKEELSHLQLAYAITIHKSQGGQAPIVIIPVSTSHYIMLARNLVYTGMTRAEEKLVFIGTKKAMNIAINNDKISQRNTRLAQRISVIETVEAGKVKTYLKGAIFK
ncbi:ATP-dependent RecD-like DNA helicase [Kroppenstedtia guangzhouensis]|uniref:ATP-dependent RecD2 DNA helicase n=2 Tax=Kroppenstedtia guangzhouensis TaxID=1274356 RepID=A0ABQ1G141_9BACL|nr:ATP-dependent RecD-like DNA helicase [Kroppenstedtia guangzhouensis]